MHQWKGTLHPSAGLVRLLAVVVAVLLVLPGVARAGGWTVTLVRPPEDLAAGTPFTVGPLIQSAHADRQPFPGLRPLITLTNLATLEVVRVPATEKGMTGHYIATITLPTTGSWRWQVQPDPERVPDFVVTLPGPLWVGPATTDATIGPPRDRYEVVADDNLFKSAGLTIRAGATVAWQNVGTRPHTVTALHGTFASGNLEPGQQFTHTFAQPGTYTYLCDYHAGMVGTINVVAAAAGQAPRPPEVRRPVVIGAAAGSAAGVTHGGAPTTPLPATGQTSPPWRGTLVLGGALLALVLGSVLRQWRRAQ